MTLNQIPVGDILKKVGVTGLALLIAVIALGLVAWGKIDANARHDPYTGSQAEGDFAIRDARLDDHERRISNGERVREKNSDLLHDIREAVRRIEGQLSK